jgi:hypothetical protein
MSFDTILLAAPGIGVGIGLAIHFARQRKQNEQLHTRILAELSKEESLSLPELVSRCGMRDGFLNRGKLLNALNPLVASGQLAQEEPPGTTMKNRLSVMRFRLKRQ